MRARFVTPAGALVLACSLMTACGSSGDGGTFRPAGRPQSAPPATSGAPAADSAGAAPTGLTTAQIDKQVLARYRAYQRAYERAYETNSPAGLDAYAMDPLLSIIAADLRKNAAKGEIWRFHNVVNPRIQNRSQTGATVLVIDCLRTLAAHRYSAKTGKRLGSFRGGTRAYQAVVRYADGTWKISNATEGQKC
ncbi:MAG TPA: hypothetical protein VFU43_13605 [Streptosporangiaceae bacterium]|nr:hypothetical protein [Streptosporangiaceae bacterium]